MIVINGHELPAHVSYSSLTTYLDCGWKYYLTRVEKVIEQPTWYLAGGSAVHTATEMYDKEELIVVDIKTGARTPSSDLQLAFYAAGMEEMFGIRPRYGAYWMGRTGQTDELIDLDYISKEDIIEIVTKFDTARRAELFMPNLNHCVMCNVKDECKYKRKG